MKKLFFVLFVLLFAVSMQAQVITNNQTDTVRWYMSYDKAFNASTYRGNDTDKVQALLTYSVNSTPARDVIIYYDTLKTGKAEVNYLLNCQYTFITTKVIKLDTFSVQPDTLKCYDVYDINYKSPLGIRDYTQTDLTLTTTKSDPADYFVVHPNVKKLNWRLTNAVLTGRSVIIITTVTR